MRAKTLNEAIKHMPGRSEEEVLKHLRKFRLPSFKKQLNKLTKKSIHDDVFGNELEDYRSDLNNYHGDSAFEWHYYYEIGNEIGRFIDKFYPYSEAKTLDPDWGEMALPSSANDDYHPAFVDIIDAWLLKEFPDWTREDVIQFWEGITDQMRYR